MGGLLSAKYFSIRVIEKAVGHIWRNRAVTADTQEPHLAKLRYTITATSCCPLMSFKFVDTPRASDGIISDMCYNALEYCNRSLFQLDIFLFITFALSYY